MLVAGRRLPYLYAISLEAALDPANDGTSHAVISRNNVALDRLDGRPLGDPANLIVDERGETVYVVNHHGSIDNAEFRQHGGRGQISVLDVATIPIRRTIVRPTPSCASWIREASARSAWGCGPTSW